MVVSGIGSGPSDVDSDRWIDQAGSCDIDLDDEHIEQWRGASGSFGAKPNRTRVSVDARSRRARNAALPRINKVTDTYNAISVLQRIPIGVEDLDAYIGAARLVRATGEERFDTTNDGEPVGEHPEPGEPIWRDDTGVTCRRWNWHQTNRTAITDTTTALFIVDALGCNAPRRAATAIEALQHALTDGSPSATRVIAQSDCATDTDSAQQLPRRRTPPLWNRQYFSSDPSHNVLGLSEGERRIRSRRNCRRQIVRRLARSVS